MRIRFSPLLATGARTMVPTLVLFSIFILVVGHDVPGGGFAGGLIASCGLLLIYLSFGDRGLRRALPADPEIILGVGLSAALIAGALGILFADAFLAYTFAEASLPLVGDIKLSSLLLFDVGVYVLVIGLVGLATLRLGGETP